MTPLVFAAIAVAGGLGAVARMVIDGLIKSRMSGAIPWGTILINVSGSLLLGFAAGLAAGQVLPEEWFLIVGTGFLGGYTTFSTASFETVRLVQERAWAASAVSALGTLVIATGAAGVGLWLGGMV
ncbi:fluoride efflux transporter CrcB [Brevibacterium metallidurans]|uniref:Fluoride-specific ion channel FluC n=1 Tax=Brevibacterium metallidurans TaxID=1482676 RepID=A0ABN0SSG7_9MICO